MQIKTNKSIRPDHKIILDLVKPNSRVLDLGCGDGTLLSLLIERKSCRCTGIEIKEQEIYKCVAKGLTVSHGDINSGLTDYSNGRFDYVILNESLQEIINLNKVIIESLRVAKKVIVGVPNFCHFSGRMQVFLRGRVPVTEELPFKWYDTPNLRFFSLKDFKDFCKTNKIKIAKLEAIARFPFLKYLPNLFGHVGIFLLEK